MAGRSPALIVKPTKTHTATLIFAHGLGDSGAGWLSLAQNWRGRGRFGHVKFIFPNAPNIPISINFGMKMPGWYDIKGFDDQNEDGQDEVGLLGSKAYFDTLIDTEVTLGIPSRRIVVGGFSQGGAVALLTGLTSPRRLAGVVGMSSYLPIGNKIPELIREAEEKSEKRKAEGRADADEVAADRETPIFMGHGDRDPMIKPAWAARSRDAIRALGWQHVEFHTYPLLEHSADPQEIDDLEAWLEKCLPDVPLEGAAASTSKV